MGKKLSVLGLILSLCLGMVGAIGCGDQSGDSEEASGSEITVVTSFYPMYVLTLNITEGVEDVKVVNMAQAQTGCLHDYQLTMEDMKVLDGADVLVINGAGMESFLDKVMEQMPELYVVTASEGMALLENEHAIHQEGVEEKNPHVWVSPTGAAEEAKNIAAGLAAADPEHAAQYQANAQEFEEQMRTLKSQMQQELDGLPHRQLITFHEAFSYFAQEFGFEIAAVIENEPGQEPVASEIDAVIQTIRENQIPAIFVESQYADQTARIIADEAGVEMYELDLIVTGDANATSEEVRKAYITAMQKNLAVLVEALK